MTHVMGAATSRVPKQRMRVMLQLAGSRSAIAWVRTASSESSLCWLGRGVQMLSPFSEAFDY